MSEMEDASSSGRNLITESPNKDKTNRIVRSGKLPRVSIHKIVCSRIPGRSSDMKANVTKIVKIYNKKSYKGQKDKYYTPVQHKKEPQSTSTFQIKLYRNKSEGTCQFLLQYGIKESTRHFNSICFYFNVSGIFAITKGISAWRVIQPYVDSNFPEKIATRLLNEEGRKAFDEKHVIGNTRTTNSKVKNSKPTDPFATATICTSYEAYLKDDASILNLECFNI